MIRKWIAGFGNPKKVTCLSCQKFGGIENCQWDRLQSGRKRADTIALLVPEKDK